MFLDDFDSHSQRFNKIQSYLRESHRCEIDVTSMSMSKANQLIKRSQIKMRQMDENVSPKEYAKLNLITEGLKLWKLSPVQTELTDFALAESIDDSIEEAKVILAAQEMQDQLQKIVEDLAEMQIQSLMPIVDAMKEEIGSGEAEQFNSSVDAALGELLDAAKQAKDTVTNAILTASGREVESSMDDLAGSEFDAPNMDDMSGEDDMDFDQPAGLDTSERKLKMESKTFKRALSVMKAGTSSGKVSKKALMESIKILKAKR